MKSRTVTQGIVKLQHGRISKGGSDSWKEEKLVLPALPPSFLIGCNIIDIRYALEVSSVKKNKKF